MAKLPACCFAIFALCCCIAFEKSFAKPAGLEIGHDPVLGVALTEPAEENASVPRDQRSPQYGFSDYDDYSDGGSARHYKNKHKHKPGYAHGGHGCRTHGHGCGGSYNNHKPGHGASQGSYASASAGSYGSGNHGGSTSQAQAASLSFGPISISTAQAQSSSRGGDYGGYGGLFGGFDY